MGKLEVALTASTSVRANGSILGALYRWLSYASLTRNNGHGLGCQDGQAQFACAPNYRSAVEVPLGLQIRRIDP